ncbi:hypothetical protein GHK86_01545 [Acidimicrobiaceae bacterium USS-CC1]|uniref:Signal transduction histidine kinase subgroup 3 dimerisation and phosphoacceptor domain-containing protein n=1 Tax=Acidiferrimicrobium australe TaxID=2664430 RepID=A0ABW9QPQ6_9ACTN|nr:hypothetical protein [Acidiferrimicrobium australe]
MVDQFRSRDQQGFAIADDERATAGLHDVVIRRLFAAALTVEEVRREPRRSVGEVDGLLAEVVGGLDDTIREVRTAIFERQRRRVAGLRDAVLATIHEATASLGFEPYLHYEAPPERQSPTPWHQPSPRCCGRRSRARRDAATRTGSTSPSRSGTAGCASASPTTGA